MRIPFLGRFLPALLLTALPLAASAGVYIGVSVDAAPPPLPVYVQPPCPQPGYIWVPGYWAWGPYGYYWVPGTWVLPPEVGLLWTPGYWGWGGGMYLWHAGYWGPTVGFYGGIDYGFGYDGDGFDGGFWRGGIFFYNRAIMRVGPGFGNDEYYRRPMHRPGFDRGRFRHVSFNGGPDGVFARPNRMDRIAARERHFALTPEQRRHDFMARGDRVLRANFNHGRPPIAATDRPSRFHGPGVFAARAAGGPFMRRGLTPRPMNRPTSAAHRQNAGPRAAFRPSNRPGPRPWSGPRYGQQPAYRPGPRFQTRPAPRFQARRPGPQYQYRPAPHFQARPAPRYQYRPAPRFQSRPAPRYQYRPAPHFQARPAPRFQNRPAPRFQYHPAPRFQARPAPRFQAHARFQPRRGPHGPPRGR